MQGKTHAMSGDLSAKMRDYLAEVYRLNEHMSERHGYVSTSALADLLDVSAPAVNRMVTKLRDMGLLIHEPYQGIALTADGEKQALLTLRKHRIAEAFLVNVMGFGWHEVYDEAATMASALSNEITQRMVEMAQNPTICPHGEPIPHADGTIATLQDVPLNQATLNVTSVITRILTRERDRLEYLEALQLVPGATLTVIHIAPFNGPMQLKVGEEYRIVGHNLAEIIRVKTD